VEAIVNIYKIDYLHFTTCRIFP